MHVWIHHLPCIVDSDDVVSVHLEKATATIKTIQTVNGVNHSIICTGIAIELISHGCTVWCWFESGGKCRTMLWNLQHSLPTKSMVGKMLSNLQRQNSQPRIVPEWRDSTISKIDQSIAEPFELSIRILHGHCYSLVKNCIIRFWRQLRHQYQAWKYFC